MTDRSLTGSFNGRSPIGVFVTAIVLTIFLSGILGYSAWRSYEDFETLETRDLRLREIHANLTRMGWIMSMSTRLAVEVDEPVWEQMHKGAEPILQEAVSEISQFVPDLVPGETAARINHANETLVLEENRALELARQGDIIAARAILTGDEYQQYLFQRDENEALLLSAINERAQTTRDSRHRRQLFTIIALGAAFPLIILTWSFTAVTMRNYLRNARRTERELRRSEENYRLAIENINEVTYKVDARADPLSGALTFVSGDVKQLTGVPAEAFIADPRTWFGLIHPEDRSKVSETTEAIIKNKAKITRSYRLMNKKTGDYTWIEDDVVPQLDDRGEVSAFFGVARDITHRKQAEDLIFGITAGLAAETGEVFYRTLVDKLAEALKADFAFIGELQPGAPDSVHTLEIYAHGKSADNFTYDLPGTPCEGVIGKQICAYPREVQKLFPDDHLLVEMGIEGYVGSPLTDSSGKPLGILVVLFQNPVENTSLCESLLRIFAVRASVEMERESADAARKESEERYKTLFEESHDAVFLASRAGRLIDINPAGVAMLGYEKEELLQLDLATELYAREEDREAYQKALAETGFVEDYEIALRCKDGTEKLFSVTANLVKDSDGSITGNWGIGRDITHQRQLEQQLIQSQKMESIGLLAGGVAHDFNNLLTAIKGYTDLALLEMPPGSPALENVYEISKATERAITVTRQLLYFSRREQLSLKVLDLNSVVRNIEKMLEQLIGEQHVIATELDSDLKSLIADPGHLEQVIVNLVLNARDAMPGGGRVLVRTENLEIDEAEAKTHPEAQPGEFVCLSVHDNGAGIDENARQRIFEPFFSTKDVGRGTGLGLAVAYGITEQHGGWIEVDSAIGRGSTFRVCLPVVPLEPEDEESRAIASKDLEGRGERILIVEDEEGVRSLVEKMLSSNGYSIVSAVDAREALEIFERDDEAIEMVFSDVVLPGENGIMLVDRLLAIKPGLPVLLASGYHEDEYRHAIDERGYRFLQKPYSLPDLMQAIKDLLADREG